jgi:hypothetical protein
MAVRCTPIELELELIKSQMAQKPILRGEVVARAMRARAVSREGLIPITPEYGA